MAKGKPKEKVGGRDNEKREMLEGNLLTFAGLVTCKIIPHLLGLPIEFIELIVKFEFLIEMFNLENC